MRISQSLCLLGLFCLPVALLTCGDDSTKPSDTPSPFLSRTSPENLLHNLLEAYEHRSVAEYESLLARNFTFILSGEDPDRPGVPGEWERESEIRLHDCMFAASTELLHLDFAPGTCAWDSAAAAWAILATKVDLHLYGVIPGRESDGPQLFVIENTWSRFWFAETGPATGDLAGWLAPGTNDPVWKIIKWKDNPIAKEGGDKPDVPASWGWLKGFYLHCPEKS